MLLRDSNEPIDLEKIIMAEITFSFLHFQAIPTLVLRIFFLLLLITILKNASRFGPCRYIKNGKCTRGKR